MNTGLVLGGGGLAGIAWEVGLLAGIRDVEPAAAGVLLAADPVVGTSAGSVVGAWITNGREPEALYEQQLTGSSAELTPEVDLADLVSRLGDAVREAGSPQDALRRIGAVAVDTSTVPEAARRAVIESRLDGLGWAERRYLVTAVNCSTGELRTFERSGGVDLVTAVGASCAVPGVWPPVTIGDHRYMDGGARSNTNADLATGSDRVVVIDPSLPGLQDMSTTGGLERELAVVGAPSFVIRADAASVAAFGTNPLDPSTRAPSARAGRDQGRALARDLAPFLR